MQQVAYAETCVVQDGNPVQQQREGTAWPDLWDYVLLHDVLIQWRRRKVQAQHQERHHRHIILDLPIGSRLLRLPCPRLCCDLQLSLQGVRAACELRKPVRLPAIALAAVQLQCYGQGWPLRSDDSLHSRAQPRHLSTIVPVDRNGGHTGGDWWLKAEAERKGLGLLAGQLVSEQVCLTNAEPIKP